ncbi:MAG: type II toxin-antitoxin system HicA family toxin [Candidatus Merdivicinus sp.]|jgi:predicted RNA binding protein YcfA (HicA-like mRNA interferase family)
MKDKDLLKALMKDGWELIRITGSHHVIKKGDQIEVIPIHGKDVPTGLLSKILKRTGLK